MNGFPINAEAAAHTTRQLLDVCAELGAHELHFLVLVAEPPRIGQKADPMSDYRLTCRRCGERSSR